MSYATVADMRDYLDQLPASVATDAKLQDILDRATAIIDTDLGFAFGTTSTTTATVYGDGTDYLQPPRFVAGSVTAVTAPTGYTAPSYVEQDGWLVVTRGGRIGTPRAGALYTYDPIYEVSVPSAGWLTGLPYTVAATYGYASVPADIVECCLEIAVRIYKAKDAGFSDVVGVDGSGAVGYSGALPNLVKRILDRYREGTGAIW